MDDLQCIRDLKAEAIKAGLKPNKHNVGNLIVFMMGQRSRYDRLLRFIGEIVSKDDKLTDSQFIQPFLEASARISAEKALSDEDPST